MSPVTPVTPESENRASDQADLEWDETLHALAHLLLAGDLALPDPVDPTAIFEHGEVSERAQAIAERVQARLFQELGVATLGNYLARAREARGLAPAQLAKDLKLARDVVADLEAERLPFYKLVPASAADLVGHLGLSSRLVIAYLLRLGPAQPSSRTTTPMYRLDHAASPKEQRQSRRKSHAVLPASDNDAQLKDFLAAFQHELERRGLWST